MREISRFVSGVNFVLCILFIYFGIWIRDCVKSVILYIDPVVFATKISLDRCNGYQFSLPLRTHSSSRDITAWTVGTMNTSFVLFVCVRVLLFFSSFFGRCSSKCAYISGFLSMYPLHVLFIYVLALVCTSCWFFKLAM